MQPIRTNAVNGVLNKPDSWQDSYGSCVGLPVCRTDDGLPLVYSWWRFTWRERVQVLLGRPVQLCIVGRTHAPVALQVASIERRSWLLEIKRWFGSK